MKRRTDHGQRSTSKLFPNRGHLPQENIVDDLKRSSVLDLSYKSIVCSAQSTGRKERDIHGVRSVAEVEMGT